MEYKKIEFNCPCMTGKEIYYSAEIRFGNIITGDGLFSKPCNLWFERRSGAYKAMLTLPYTHLE